MILILEDDADREAYQRGAVELKFRNIPEEARHPDLRPTTVWISPEAYARERVLTDLRAQVDALPGHYGDVIERDKVLDLIDRSSE